MNAAIIYTICQIIGVLGLLVSFNVAVFAHWHQLPAFWIGAAGCIWCAAWMIAGRIYVMRHP